MLVQGWAGIPVSRDSREYKPQISCPFPSRGILIFPFPFPGKGSFGRELGREILLLFAVFNIFLCAHYTLRKSKSKSVESIFKTFFFYNCVNLLQISSLHWLKKLWLRMACQGMKIILNLILLFIWFPGFPGIPGITSLKFPFPSRSNLRIPVPFP